MPEKYTQYEWRIVNGLDETFNVYGATVEELKFAIDYMMKAHCARTAGDADKELAKAVKALKKYYKALIRLHEEEEEEG